MTKTEIPNEWFLANYSDILISASNGIGGNQNKAGIGIPVTRIETIADEKIDYTRLGYLAEYDLNKIDKHLLNMGDILFSHINSPSHLGKTAIYKGDRPLYHGINLLRIVVNQQVIVPELFNYHCKYLRTIGIFSLNAQHAVNQSSINQKKLATFEISLPPLAEQKVIAEKLDVMLANVERIKARLELIPIILKLFRQSVLANAVSGKLTEEWRKESNIPTGSLVRLKDVVEVNPKKERYQDELDVGFVPMSKMNEGTDYKLKFEPEKWGKVKKGYTSFKNNDVLLAKITPCFENGKSAIVTGLPNGVGAGSTEYIVLRNLENKVLPGLIAFNISTKAFLSEGALSMTGSVGHKRVPKEFVENWLIYLPHKEEQKRICHLVNQAFDYAKKIESETINALKKIELLSPSILAKAFKGELTEKWRKENSDLISGANSAEALLAKIKYEMNKK